VKEYLFHWQFWVSVVVVSAVVSWAYHRFFSMKAGT
jgi:hypothetical protein